MAFETIACCRIGLPGPGPTAWAVRPLVNVPLRASSRAGQARFARRSLRMGRSSALTSRAVGGIHHSRRHDARLGRISAAERVAGAADRPVLILTAFS